MKRSVSKQTEQFKMAKRRKLIDSLANLSTMVGHIKNNWVDIEELSKKISNKFDIKSKGIT